MANTDTVAMDDGPAEKTKKYDRQLRLWGEHGQASLENAKVCLINATASGTETLKNLILPGIGSFTIVDGHKVSGADVGNNFFLEQESIGKARAQVATELLLELNDDVSGDFVDESIENLLDNNQVLFNNFSIVIATDLQERTLVRLAALLWDYDVPLLLCRSYGMMGYLRLAVREHTIVESHPDNAIEDLRLDEPFPSLVNYCDSQDLGSMSKKDHSHTPWLVLIYKYLQQWKLDHNGEGPKNYREKTQFKEYIRNGMHKNELGVPMDEENFDEAIKNVNTALLSTKIPYEVEQIFSDTKCTELHSESSSFWILARALRDFAYNEGQGKLPLRGSIPDMTADSERYVQLQNVYKHRAEEHVTHVTNHVNALLHTIGRDKSDRSMGSPLKTSHVINGTAEALALLHPQDIITDTDIRKFCRNAHFLRVQSGRSLTQEYAADTAQTSDLAMNLEDPDSDVVFYVLLRAVEKFYAEFSRYPGTSPGGMEADIAKLKFCATKQMQEWGLTTTIKDEYIQECCRYGAGELHSVAAYMGGVAAQEVIKVITGQFVPVNNTYIYNAIKQSSVTLTL